jgi:hypothetical protein
MSVLKDGTGTGKLARVDTNNKIEVHSVQETEGLPYAEWNALR